MGIILLVGTTKEMDRTEMWISLGILIPLQIVMFYLFRKAGL
jgi:hypothetical protein